MILEWSAAKGCLSRRWLKSASATMRAAILGRGTLRDPCRGGDKGKAARRRLSWKLGPPPRGRRRSHVLEHHPTEARTADLRGAVHEAGEIVGDLLRQDRFLERADDQVRGLGPAHVTQHHLG